MSGQDSIDDRPTLADVQTPALVLDHSVVAANAEAMTRRACDLGVELRPHLKTAKSAAVAELVTQGGPRKITVSTLAEAEYFAERGFRDVTYAVNITPGKLARVAELERGGCAVRLLVDDPGVAREIARHATDAGVTLRALVDIDTGLHRSGLAVDDPLLLETARILHEAPDVRFEGVLTHAGNSYGATSADDIRRIAGEERDGAVAAARRLADAGIPSETVSVGSTPTARFADHLEGVTEMRPGNYVFFDLFQWLLGCCHRDQIAVSVLATVISHAPRFNRLLIDAGGLALSKDRSTADHPSGGSLGYGLLVEASGEPISGDLVVRDVNQEHGFVESAEPIDFAKYPIGSRVRVLPNHSCMTAAAYETYHVVEGRSAVVVDLWDRVNGW